MTIDVYHRQKLAEDLLLGRAHVPLAPLLQVPAGQRPAGLRRVGADTACT